MKRRADIPDRFRCPMGGERRHAPESNLIARCPHGEDAQRRRRSAENAPSGIDTQKDSKTGCSGDESRESGRFGASHESGF